MYHVLEAEWTDTSFKDIVFGTEAFHGPFETYEKALDQWKRCTFSPKLDICCHRAFIFKEA